MSHDNNFYGSSGSRHFAPDFYRNEQAAGSSQRFDVSRSTLEPTVEEFRPSSSNGAIRKKTEHYQNNSKPNKVKTYHYGSGRTYHSRRVYYGQNEGGSGYREDGSRYPEGSKREFNRNTTEYLSNDVEVDKGGPTDTYKENQNFYNRASNNFKKHYNRGGEYGENARYSSGYDKHYTSNNKFGNYNKNRGQNFDKNEYQKEKDENPHEQYEERSETTSKSKYNGYYNKDRYQDRNSKDNWRNKNQQEKCFKQENKISVDAASQRDRLIEMLNQRQLECLVCCDKIKHIDKVWSCSQCYHILHLTCVSAWAKSSKVENGWRCPACQNMCPEVPKQYRCYCNKSIEPKNAPGIVPHGCGEMCLRKGRHCEHKCTILCHPGPCPDCEVMVVKPCGCGATGPIVKCSAELEIVCEGTCGKTLECGVHKCEAKCHQGSCAPCKETIKQECYCGKSGRKVPCTWEHAGSTAYSCDDECGKTLSCGNHKCQKKCHPGPCDTCARDISIVDSCYCGRTPLEKERTTCLDPIPCCDKVCGKQFNCGQPGAPHYCKETCHEGPCPPCPLTTMVKCRCGHMDKELPCKSLTSRADDARCEKKCTKRRLCGKHKCNQRCCIEAEHECPQMCVRPLSCGRHRCSRSCHPGRCAACPEATFEELRCACGAAVLYPPVQCGARPPPCDRDCRTQRACGHPPNHSCHPGECPPCFVLTKRWCHGRHEERSAVPCSQEDFSCGLPCGKSLPCGRHRCDRPCHAGPCPVPCRQPCAAPRALCGHACGLPCHDGPCSPDGPCRALANVACQCGLRRAQRPCTQVADELRRLQMARLREKMESEARVGVDDEWRPPSVLKILECTEECRVYERNRRLAIGLQIRNPDLSQKLTPRYSDFLRSWAKRDPPFVLKVHDALAGLVRLAQSGGHNSRSHSFPAMNREKRKFIHEYCEHFGVDSEAYDPEPNRNVVATAKKDKCWMPSASLLEVMQRESGQRKVPPPAQLSSNLNTRVPSEAAVALRLPSKQASSTSIPQTN